MSRAAALPGALQLLVPRRSERRYFALFVVALGALAFLPASIAYHSFTPDEESAHIAASAVKLGLWALAAALIWRMYAHGIRIRRLRDVVYRARDLRETIGRRATAVERLAVLQEMQNCYDEADRYIAKINDEEMVSGMKALRVNIDRMYSEAADEARRAGGSAGEFASAMEMLGRERGDGEAAGGR